MAALSAIQQHLTSGLEPPLCNTHRKIRDRRKDLKYRRSQFSHPHCRDNAASRIRNPESAGRASSFTRSAKADRLQPDGGAVDSFDNKSIFPVFRQSTALLKHRTNGGR
jgi:hypothetical protein